MGVEMSFNDINGTPNFDDVLAGTQGDDRIRGESGNDFINAGQGNDLVIGGSGSDVVRGGLGADAFEWSAGHITDGATDWVIDFSLTVQNDLLSFISSGGGQDVNVLSVVLTKLLDTEFNGFDLENNVETGTEIVFTVQNSVTGNIQDIVLLDAWSGATNDAWVDYLATLGLEFS
jgi:Ca2+-binding RTX toxin-like protein